MRVMTCCFAPARARAEASLAPGRLRDTNRPGPAATNHKSRTELAAHGAQPRRAAPWPAPAHARRWRVRCALHTAGCTVLAGLGASDDDAGSQAWRRLPRAQLVEGARFTLTPHAAQLAALCERYGVPPPLGEAAAGSQGRAGTLVVDSRADPVALAVFDGQVDAR
jgi:hypothetical protein